MLEVGSGTIEKQWLILFICGILSQRMYGTAAPCVDEHGMRVDGVAARRGGSHNTTVGDASCHHVLRVVLHVLHSQHVV